MMNLTRESLEKYNDKSGKEEETNYIKVGMSTCGIAAGSDRVYLSLLDEINNKNIPVKLDKCGCLGMCYAEPMIEVKIENQPAVFYGYVKEEDVPEIIEKSMQGQIIENLVFKSDNIQKKIVLRNCGLINPESIEDYLSKSGYQALKKSIFELNPDLVIEEMKKSGLRGRGGAGFPTHLKWTFTKNVQSEEKFVICNADEGDPGAYMDRSVLEGDPHSVIEGMMIAAFATGSPKGIFYIRAEYPLAIERIQKAINDCYKCGILGSNVLGSDFKFDIEIRLGAGAFVCGEETALIASIEGKRGYPKPRPPFPAVKGLWNKPTVINNVETLANVAYILLHGGESFGSIGTEKSKGTKVFALTGKIKNSGLVEVPMGVTLRQIIEEIGGGILNNKKIKAVQTGGPSGGLIPVDYLDTQVSYEHLDQLGSIMGSGGMIVLDEDDCVVDIAKFYLGFCVDESCGKCAPCRIGGIQMLNLLEKISSGNGEIKDLQRLKLISKAMQKASLCGLGQTAPNPIVSALRYFEAEYLEHINDKKCSSGKCKALNTYSIITETCVKCGMCQKNCPVGAIEGDRTVGFTIKPEVCIKCNKCFEICKFNAIKK